MVNRPRSSGVYASPRVRVIVKAKLTAAPPRHEANASHRQSRQHKRARLRHPRQQEAANLAAAENGRVYVKIGFPSRDGRGQSYLLTGRGTTVEGRIVARRQRQVQNAV